MLAPNKTLAAQLASEFRELFPKNRVEYFVSYYDYYQPEAYLPSTDTYIEKDSSINDEIDRLRHSATSALMSRRDVIIVASVSAIYGLGGPEEYARQCLILDVGEEREQRAILARLVELQYERNDYDFARNKFRVRGDTIEVFPAYEERGVRISLFGDEVERIASVDPLTGEIVEELERLVLFPASHYVTSDEHMKRAIEGIEAELVERLAWFEKKGKLLEAQRLRMRTTYDLEMLREIGVCSGIENYSRHLDGRAAGQMPYTLLDYFPDDFVVVVDESHLTIPQLHGQYEGDKSRKDTLVDHGFRLPSAMDNRPLRFRRVRREGEPGGVPLGHPERLRDRALQPGGRADRAARPGLIDPEIVVKPTKGQIDDLVHEIKVRADDDQRVLVTTLTKKMAEDLTEYLLELGMRVRYLHSEVDTLERVEILRGLRLGDFDVLVGINLLREGLDLPEVSLVAILDADKEGFLRSETVAHPDHRSRRSQRRGSGDHVRRPDDRLDAPRHLRDQPSPQEAARVQHRARHRPADRPQEGHRHPRDAPRRRRRRTVAGDAGVGGGEAVSRNARRCSTSPTCRPTISAGSSRPSRTRCTTPRPTSASRKRPVSRRDQRAEARAPRRRLTAGIGPRVTVHLVDQQQVTAADAAELVAVVRGQGIPLMESAGAVFVLCEAAPDLGDDVDVLTVWSFRDFVEWNRIRRDLMFDPRYAPYAAELGATPPWRHPPLLPGARAPVTGVRRSRSGPPALGDVLAVAARARGAASGSSGPCASAHSSSPGSAGAPSAPTPRARRSSWSGRRPTSPSVRTAPPT